MKLDVDAIKKLIEKQRIALTATYNVEKLGVFGSVARGDNNAESDIDMLVKLSKPIGMFRFIELENYLTELLGKKVDLVTDKALKPLIKEEILQEVVYV